MSVDSEMKGEKEGKVLLWWVVVVSGHARPFLGWTVSLDIG